MLVLDLVDLVIITFCSMKNYLLNITCKSYKSHYYFKNGASILMGKIFE